MNGDRCAGYYRRTTVVLIVLAVSALAGCSSGNGGNRADETAIRGVTMVDGGCPAARANSPCPDRPIAAHLTVTDPADQRVVARVTTDPYGRFRLALQAGKYTIHPTNTTGAVVPIAAPVDVTVSAGSVTDVTIHFDSGVR